jgi:hypothetical protein
LLLYSYKLVLEFLVLGCNRAKLSRRNTKNVIVWTFGIDALGISRGVSLRDLARLEAVYYIG